MKSIGDELLIDSAILIGRVVSDEQSAAVWSAGAVSDEVQLITPLAAIFSSCPPPPPLCLLLPLCPVVCRVSLGFLLLSTTAGRVVLAFCAGPAVPVRAGLSQSLSHRRPAP